MSQALATRTLNGVEIPAAGTWEVDPVHSAVTFVARHLMVSKVRGSFGRFEGTLHIDEVPERSTAEIRIDVSSIDTREPKRDEHLRSADFLDVESHPEIRFFTNGLTPTGDRTFRLAGDLTIRSVTRPVILDVTYEGVSPDPWGGVRAGFSATTEIDREDFGITWNQALETGGVLVGKKVRIELEVQAIKR